MHDELDLIREASNAAQLRRNMDGLDLVLIPEIFWDFCHAEVMVMQRMTGVPISQVQQLRDAGAVASQTGARWCERFSSPRCFAMVFSMPICTRAISRSASIRKPLALHLAGLRHRRHPDRVDKEYLAQTSPQFFRRDYKRVAELHIESG